MESADNPRQLHALLEWQVELGATDAIGDVPIDRFATASSEKQQPVGPDISSNGPTAPNPPLGGAEASDPVAAAEVAAGAAKTLVELQSALADYHHCELRLGAQNLVFADGTAGAKVMIIGEAPGRDEDIQGRPFVGRAGQLLDKMLAAVGLSRQSREHETSVYITNVLPWRPPQNRDPTLEEIAMMLPFMRRHVALANPDFVVLMGNISCQAALGRRGITRLRGSWTQAYGKPALPMFHPAYLLRNPAAKREAWADLLEIKAYGGQE
ncbi:MAG: uracil-DNA glycosylase [Pseudomonadota bacterium]